MPDAVKLLQKKFLILKSVALIFTTLFFFMIAPIEQLEPIRNIDPVILFSSALLFIVGIVFLIEFTRNLPHAGNHNGAKSGAAVFLVLGIIAFGYGFVTLFDLYDPFANAGVTDIPNIGLTILLGVVSLLLYASIHPELVGFKSLSHAIKQTA